MTVQNIDLGFRPAPERDGKRLRADQVAQYNTLGFVQPFDVFGPEEIGRIRAYFDRLMADLGEAGHYGINCYQARMAGIWDIATDPRILDHVQDIIGPRHRLLGQRDPVEETRTIRGRCPGTRMPVSGS
jgi:non-heme Fe2+,alpha-ketoglutarate-dependent halogenase